MLLRKTRKSLKDALSGLKTVWAEEHNFRIEVVAAIAVVFSIFYFNFSYIESAFSILAIIIVIAAEIVNTVIEDLCDRIEPNHDETIGKIKDTMAAFVLVSVTGAIIIGIIIFVRHFSAVFL